MKALRIVVVIFVLVAAIVSVRQYCVLPYLCNLTTKRVMTLTERLRGKPDYVVLVGVRDNLDSLRSCEDCFATNIGYLMVKAANEGALQDYAAAEATYRKALSYDRRPELYLNLGLTQLNLGRTAEGTQSLLTACRFSFAMIVDIPEPEKGEMYTVISRERTAIEERLRRTRKR
jgi:tetratricopeptide (TPR) repeat protein